MSAVTIAARPPRRKTDRPSGWAIGMATLAGVASIVVLVLIALVLWMSVIDGEPGDPDLAYTTANYIETFGDPFVWRVLGNTVAFSALTLIVAMAVGAPIAWLVERTDFPAKTLVFATMTIGLLVPGFVTAIGWEFLLHPRIGMVNTALIALFHLSGPPISITNLWGMGWVQGLGLAPVAFVMTSVVLRAMDPALEDAAAVSGAHLRGALLRVTLPLAWPGLLAAGIFIFMIGFSAFDVPAIIGLAGKVYTFATYTFEQMQPAVGDPQFGEVAAFSTVTVALGLVLSWWYARMQRRAPQYAVVTGKGYRPRLLALTGSGRACAIAFVGIYLFLSQLLPVLVILWTSTVQFPQPPTMQAIATMSFANYLHLPMEMVWRGLKNTAILMVLAPVITLAIALSISWLVLRSRVPGRALFDFVAFLPLSVPSIVFSMAALVLALFVLNRVVPIYGTIWLLLLVYVVSRISYATRITNSALIRDPSRARRRSADGGGGARRRHPQRAGSAAAAEPRLRFHLDRAADLSRADRAGPALDQRQFAARSRNLDLWTASQFAPASAIVVIMLVAMMPLIYLGFWVSRGRALADR